MCRITLLSVGRFGLFVLAPAVVCAQDADTSDSPEVLVEVMNDSPLSGEPLKLKVTIENKSGIPIELPGVIDKASLGFEWSKGGGLRSSVSPADYLSLKSSKSRQLAPMATIVTYEMIANEWGVDGRFHEPGEYSLTAKFKGRQSKAIKIIVKAPDGADKSAYELLRKERLLGYLTFYWDAPLQERPLRELQKCLESFPESRFAPWLRVALATNEVLTGNEEYQALKAESASFKRAMRLLEDASKHPTFPFCSEIIARMGKLYVNAGLGDFGKGLLIRARECNDIPDSWRNEIGAMLKKSEVLK